MAPRWTAEEWREANDRLWLRSGGRCEHCGDPLNGRAERHHRQRRRDGGDRLSNLLLVLPEHHEPVIHANPAESIDLGWIVPTWVPDPASIPVRVSPRRWFRLDDDGGRTPAQPPC